MNTFFQFVMYMIFGKRWIKYEMLQGYKMAIFVNEAEIEMDRAKLEEATARKEKLEADMTVLMESELPDAMTLLSDEEKEDKKAVQKMEHKIRQEREDQVKQFMNQIRSATTDIGLADGALNKTYSIAYTNRRKFDYMKNYKIKRTYADDNK